MTLSIIFLASGVALATLVTVKHMEEKRKRSFVILQLISRGDHQVREVSHRLSHWYADAKSNAQFFIEKQLPMRTKNLYNKSRSFVEEKVNLYMENIRGSKLLKKSDGISEFFKNLSEVEKGNGHIEEINFDNIEDADQVARTLK